jgi:hypothetical protein
LKQNKTAFREGGLFGFTGSFAFAWPAYSIIRTKKIQPSQGEVDADDVNAGLQKVLTYWAVFYHSPHICQYWERLSVVIVRSAATIAQHREAWKEAISSFTSPHIKPMISTGVSFRILI